LVLAALAVRHADRPAGVVTSDLGVRAREADGRDVVLISQGDAFDFIYGSDRAGYTVLQLSARTVLKISWFVLWRWWVRGTWFGWKLLAWRWAVWVQLDEDAMKHSALIQKRAHANRQEEDRSVR
jgi:hypothetical protein